MLVYVGETLFWLWAISLPPPIKLFHDTGESMDDMKKKKVLSKTITVETACSVGA